MNKYFKKFHRFSPKLGSIQSRQKYTYGNYAIRALAGFNFKKNQIEACRKAILKILKQENKLIDKKLSILANKKDYFCSLKIALFPNFAMSEKPKEVRMGKGKGAVSYYYFPVKKGRIVFELKNVTHTVALKCFSEIFHKVPKPLRLISSCY
jgi:large subunit ribosomal protein L16